MGAWDVHYQGSDTYLDILDDFRNDLMELAETKEEEIVVASAGLFYDIFKNQELYYNGTEQEVRILISALEEVLSKENVFKNWNDPDARRKAVEDLLDKLKELEKNPVRFTTLGVRRRD